MNDKKGTSDAETRQNVRAVFEDDIALLICKLGLQKDIEERKRTCSLCSQPITHENVGMIYKKDGRLNIICNGPLCLATVTPELEE